MARDTGTDDPRVRIRPGKRSRPRTKVRPDWSTKPLGRVVAIDRGRYTVVLDEDGIRVQTVRAKELGRGTVIMGDRVRLTGDLSGKADTLGRIVAVEERENVLRRSLEDAPDQRGEKAIIANAAVMVIVVALADPPPRTGMIDRCLVAAYEAGMEPVLCLTKADLADPSTLLDAYADFNMRSVVTTLNDTPSDKDRHQPGIEQLREIMREKWCVFVGHSGVGKSTLINAVVPDAQRATGHVNEVTGRGRHTSTSSEAFELPGGGWVVDTPGVRSFGLGHVSVEDVLAVFPDVEEAAQWCLPLCSHAESEASCAIDRWVRGSKPFLPLEASIGLNTSSPFDEGGGEAALGKAQESSVSCAVEAEAARRLSRAASVRRLLDAVATAEAASKAAR